MSRKRGNASYLEDLRYHLNSALLLATLNGDTMRMRHILDAGAEPNQRTSYTYPLYEGTRRGNVEVVRVLIEHGANANTVSGHPMEKDTALHEACRRGFAEIAGILLDAGADVNARGNRGLTPLDVAVCLPEANPAREEILDLFRERHPQLVMEVYCSRSKSPQL